MASAELPPPLERLALDPGNRPALGFLPRPGLGPRAHEIRDEYDLDAPYQRGSVWTVDQRRALIYSLLRKLPIGSVIVAVQGPMSEKYYRVVDGKQRIETIRMWDRGEVDVPGWWFRAEQLVDGEAARRRMVTTADLNDYGRRTYEDWHINTIETDATTAWTPVPSGTGTHGSNKQFNVRTRTDAERLAYEAELYGLINGGGTPQTDADMARAAALADG